MLGFSQCVVICDKDFFLPTIIMEIPSIAFHFTDELRLAVKGEETVRVPGVVLYFFNYIETCFIHPQATVNSLAKEYLRLLLDCFPEGLHTKAVLKQLEDLIRCSSMKVSDWFKQSSLEDRVTLLQTLVYLGRLEDHGQVLRNMWIVGLDRIEQTLDVRKEIIMESPEDNHTEKFFQKSFHLELEDVKTNIFFVYLWNLHYRVHQGADIDEIIEALAGAYFCIVRKLPGSSMTMLWQVMQMQSDKDETSIWALDQMYI